MDTTCSAEAPSNIALIKYMGKVEHSGKTGPANSSVSYTLPHLRTAVEITSSGAANDEWQPLNRDGWTAPDLSTASRERFLRHFQLLKNEWSISGNFVVRSANNFPSDCGVASSASSFAALTMATHELAKACNPHLDITRSQLAELSRKGSGSSIRSFYGPFALWNAHPDGQQECSIWSAGIEKLHHQVVIVAGQKKSVSSSEAHKRVTTSMLYKNRPERAEERLRKLTQAFESRVDWRAAYEIVAAEFWDMHSLFHTSQPPFHYITSATIEVLDHVEHLWEHTGDGPMVTLDAGPNAHLLYRANQLDLAREFADRLSYNRRELKILSSYEMGEK